MIDIAILGYGVVGSGVAEVVEMNQEAIRRRTGRGLRIKRILDIRDFPGDPFADRIVHDPETIFNDPDIAVVAETIGGTGAAYAMTRRALEAGKHVVTSNKELVALHGPELMSLAYRMQLNYLFEASVGGGIPIIRPLHKCLAANEIDRISGILNGTTNYILTRMEKTGLSFGEALAEAQAKGYAEQDPTADVEGTDAARKIAILSSIAYEEYVDARQVRCEGISQLSREDMACAGALDCRLKLLASSRRTGDGRYDIRVAPTLVPKDHPLAVAEDVYNAILVEGNALGQAMFYGRGAGRLPTASAVVADVVESVLHIGRIPHFHLWRKTDRDCLVPPDEAPVSACLRVTGSPGSPEASEAALRAALDRLGETCLVERISGFVADPGTCVAVRLGGDGRLTEAGLARIRSGLETGGIRVLSVLRDI